MKYKIVILLFLFLINCTSKKEATDQPSEDTTNQKGNISGDQPGNLGDFIFSIDFNVKATSEDAKDFDDGIIPWISIEDPEKEISRLIEADKIVLPYSKVVLIFDYPLDSPVQFEISTSENGFSRKQLIREISKKYKEIYKEEETSATIKTVPAEKREGLMNRNKTNGKYGIWGHDLGDLDLSTVEVYKKADDIIYIMLGIES
jgi:hypothetical protein